MSSTIKAYAPSPVCPECDRVLAAYRTSVKALGDIEEHIARRAFDENGLESLLRQSNELRRKCADVRKIALAHFKTHSM